MDSSVQSIASDSFNQPPDLSDVCKDFLFIFERRTGDQHIWGRKSKITAEDNRRLTTYGSSSLDASLSKSILLTPWELAVARSYPEMIMEYLPIRDKKCRKSSCRERSECRCEICEFRGKYGVRFDKLKMLDEGKEGIRFIVTTADKGYTLKNLYRKVISSCFSKADVREIELHGLPVPSIWDLPKQGNLLVPLHKDILKELEAEAAVHRQFPIWLPRISPFPSLIRSLFYNDWLSSFDDFYHNNLPSGFDGFYQSPARTSPGQSILLYPEELELAHLHPEMFIEYLSLRHKKCSKSSCGDRNAVSVCGCEFCKFCKKYQVQLGKLKVPNGYAEGVRFMVTTAETGYTMTNLPARVLSECFYQEDQVDIAAFGLAIPSIWDLPSRHLLKPLRKDIFKELEAEAGALSPSASGSWSYLPFEVRPTSLAGISDQATCSGDVMINMALSTHAASNPESGRIFSQVDSGRVKSQPDASSDPETGNAYDQPKNKEAEPLFNRARMTEATLLLAAQVSLTLVTNGSSGSNSFSRNDGILKQFATICNATGFLCCLCGILVFGRKPRLAARIITGLGYILTAYGFLAITGMTLRDDLKLWFTAATCTALFPVLAFAFMK